MLILREHIAGKGLDDKVAEFVLGWIDKPDWFHPSIDINDTMKALVVLTNRNGVHDEYTIKCFQQPQVLKLTNGFKYGFGFKEGGNLYLGETMEEAICNGLLGRALGDEGS